MLSNIFYFYFLLWKEADVAVYSAILEAVNIWPLEYVLARSLFSQPAGTKK